MHHRILSAALKQLEDQKWKYHQDYDLRTIQTFQSLCKKKKISVAFSLAGMHQNKYETIFYLVQERKTYNWKSETEVWYVSRTTSFGMPCAYAT